MAPAKTALPLEPLFNYAQLKADLPIYAEIVEEVEAEEAKASGSKPKSKRIFTDKLFARMIGVSARTVARWRAAGDKLPWDSADEAATALGEWSPHIWQDAWFDMDCGIYDGTDEKALAEIEKALAQVGEILAQEAAASTPATVEDHEHLHLHPSRERRSSAA